jgi:hypothetical protein
LRVVFAGRDIDERRGLIPRTVDVLAKAQLDNGRQKFALYGILQIFDTVSFSQLRHSLTNST